MVSHRLITTEFQYLPEWMRSKVHVYYQEYHVYMYVYKPNY